MIDYFKNCIAIHPEWKNFGFEFSDTSTYEDISGFYREVELQGYKIDWTYISEKDIDLLQEKGQLYLFQIYNKDFSTYSKGTPNMHTFYWKMLFDQRNLTNAVYKLNGEAEVFYRRASIKTKNIIITNNRQLEQDQLYLENGKSLIERNLIYMGSTLEFPGCLGLFDKQITCEEIFIIGGGEIYRQTRKNDS